MGVTEDPNDPCINEIGDDGQQACYVVLSEKERAKGFIRPLRTSYIHDTCGTVTTMGTAIAETYARDPFFYGGTFCVRCRNHFPVGANGEFVWTEPREGTPFGQADRVGT